MEVFNHLLFMPNTSDNYMMDLCMLPKDTNLKCNNVKMFGEYKNNEVYFLLSRKFDIFFSIQSITNFEQIKKLVLYADEEKIRDIEFGEELNIPLYKLLFTPFYIKATFANNILLSDIEMIYSAGLLQNMYRDIKY